MGKGVRVGAGGAGRAWGVVLLIVSGGGVEAVADKFEHGGKAARTEPRSKLQENEAEGVS